MGTRGLVAFHVDGVTKAGYTHWDSYPDGLGVDTLAFARRTPVSEIRTAALALQVVSEDDTPTPEQVESLRKYANMNVGSQEITDWYVLLRETQGDPAKILDAGYVLDSFAFGHDSLFCEWAYVLDLDVASLDVYRGFNTSGKAVGLWSDGAPEDSDHRPSGYDSVTRVAQFPLDALPDDKAFLAAVDPEDES